MDRQGSVLLERSSRAETGGAGRDDGGRPLDPASKDVTRDNIGRLFRRAMETFNLQLQMRLQVLGYRDIRPRHFTVFSHLDLDGTRAAELARRAGMTRQSMGELVAQLVGLGYLEQRPDPTDRRSKVVMLTAKGVQHVRAARRTINDINRGWEDRVGSDRMRALRATLEELALASTEPASQGAPNGVGAPSAT